MGFHDIRFPVEVARGARGGPVRRTEIITLASGHEERNSPWAGSRRRFNAGIAVTTLDAIEQVVAFFEARHGRLHSFRWRDPLDWKSCPVASDPSTNDQALGTGDGNQVTFQLLKSYSSGEQSYERRITKPVQGSVFVAVDGIAQTLETDFTVNSLTGEVTFVTPPVVGAVITSGFEFDVQVRFDTDELTVSLDDVRAGHVPDIPVVEVLA